MKSIYDPRFVTMYAGAQLELVRQITLCQNQPGDPLGLRTRAAQCLDGMYIIYVAAMRLLVLFCEMRVPIHCNVSMCMPIYRNVSISMPIYEFVYAHAHLMPILCPFIVMCECV